MNDQSYLDRQTPALPACLRLVILVLLPHITTILFARVHLKLLRLANTSAQEAWRTVSIH